VLIYTVYPSLHFNLYNLLNFPVSSPDLHDKIPVGLRIGVDPSEAFKTPSEHDEHVLAALK